MDDIIAVLFVITAVLLFVFILMTNRKLSRYQKLKQENETLRNEVAKLKTVNRTLMSNAGIGPLSRAKRNQVLFEFIRDLEAVRAAVAGAKVAQETLERKYGLKPGEELLNRILANPEIETSVKNGIADEILVGEVGRTLMKCLEKGMTIDEASEKAGVPLSVARGQVIRLQLLGYIDSRLKPTEKGNQSII
ncbi:MAG: hypothetical protein QXG10_04480 [Candidatus Hadarchaeales archaeon]